MPIGQTITLPQLQPRSLLLGGKPKLPVFQLPQVQLQPQQQSSGCGVVVDERELNADVEFLATHLRLDPQVRQLYETELGVQRRRVQKTHVSPARRWSKTSHGESRKRKLRTVRSLSDVRSPEVAREELRAELMQSLTAMNDFNNAVKRDLSVIRRLVPAVREQGRGFAALLGADKLFATMRRMLQKRVERRFAVWAAASRELTRTLHLRQMHKYRALRRIVTKLDHCATRKMAGWFDVWFTFTISERNRLRALLEDDSAVTIQRFARGWVTRLKLLRARERAGYVELYEATLKLQAFFRGRLSRMAYVAARTQHLRQCGALVIQRVARGYFGRNKARRMRLQRNRGLAATIIQAWARGCAGRKIAKRLRWQRAQHIAALTIQRAARRWLACQRVQRLRLLKAQALSAIVIQKYARRWLCQRRLQTTLDERQREFEIRSAAAVKIQAVYRGHRARLRHKTVILQYRAQIRRRANAALTIQCATRCRIARKKLLAVKIERMTEWVEKAQQVVEMWSEDAQAYFYYNQTTGEAGWEPSPDGYTKADGQLVLLTGQIISDPLSILDELLGQQNQGGQTAEDVLCVECSKRFAVRLCMQCEDKFCTKCFRETHTGKRGGHSYQELGLVECSECEEVLAVRWCIPCDDAFCDPCWRKLHTKGKRRQHPFSEVAADGAISSKIVTIDGREIDYYDPALYAQSYDASYEHDTQVAQGFDQTTAQQATTDEWLAYLDQNQHTYYYNQYTGETTYEYPFS